MNREGIRRLAAEELGLPTSPYRFAGTYEEFRAAIDANSSTPNMPKPPSASVTARAMRRASSRAVVLIGCAQRRRHRPCLERSTARRPRRRRTCHCGRLRGFRLRDNPSHSAQRVRHSIDCARCRRAVEAYSGNRQPEQGAGVQGGILALSLRLPRCGVGARYGASVSDSRRSMPIDGSVERRPEFLNVTIPLMPK